MPVISGPYLLGAGNDPVLVVLGPLSDDLAAVAEVPQAAHESGIDVLQREGNEKKNHNNDANREIISVKDILVTVIVHQQLREKVQTA